MTTDYSGDGYEVTVAKSDGTKVEIHLDNSFDVTARPQPGWSTAAGLRQLSSDARRGPGGPAVASR